MATTLKALMTRTALFAALTSATMGAVGCDAQGQTIGPRGGLIASEDGRFSLDIPEGALERDVDLMIEEVDCDLGDAIGACYVVLPRGTTFALPVEVAYEVADMNVSEDIAVVAEAADGWRVLPDRDVDLDDSVVYGSAMYLTEYGLANIH